ncbi:hypothetical protein FRC04_005466 [Tulasnella sp. 424]|nr:hypothetical protein FRC04_005466 [Tulasnella sp. 424]
MLFELLDWTELKLQEPPLTLAKLREIKLENMTMGGSRYVLGSLCAPALRNLELKENLQRDLVASLLHPQSPLLLESIRHALPRNEIFSILIGSEFTALQISGEGRHVGISLRCQDPDELSCWVAEEFVLELSYVSEMRLRVSSTRPSSELQGLQKLMEGLDNVDQLVSPNVTAGAAALLVEHLASPYQTSAGWRWRWPDLRYVELDDAWKWSNLTLTMIQERYGSSQEEHGNPSGGAPNW